MIGIRISETKTKKTYATPEERVKQARLRLFSATKIKNENPSLKRTIRIPAIAGAFVAGFITGFSPSVSRAISREAVSLLRLLAVNQMNRYRY